MNPKIHEGELSEVDSWFCELPLILHCNQHKKRESSGFFGPAMAAFTQASTRKDGDPPSWAVYLVTLDKKIQSWPQDFHWYLRGYRFAEWCTVACGVLQDLEAIEFGNPDTLHQKKGPVQHCATLESKLNAKRCKECEAVCVFERPWRNYFFGLLFDLLLRPEASEEEEERADQMMSRANLHCN